MSFSAFRVAKNTETNICVTDKPYDMQHVAVIRSCENCKCTTPPGHATIHLYYVRATPVSRLRVILTLAAVQAIALLLEVAWGAGVCLVL